MNLKIFGFLALCISEIFGDTMLKFYANGKGITYLMYGIFGYIGVVISLIYCLMGSDILYVNAMWDGLSAFLESAFAFFILGERFENYYQYIGIFVIILGILLINLRNKPINIKERFTIMKKWF